MRAIRTLAARLAALVVLAGGSYAQSRDVEPYHAIVTADRPSFRCGPSQLHYVVGQLEKGAVVLVDGEDGGWARVAYPQGMSAWVKADEVQFNQANSTATLTKGSRLRALSMLGVQSSWQPLLAEARAMGPGGTLRVVETLQNPDNSLAGYKIVPPDTARGYVEGSALRRATPEEVAAKGASLPPANKPAQPAAAAHQPPAASPVAANAQPAGHATPGTTPPAAAHTPGASPATPGSTPPGAAPVAGAPSQPGTPGATTPPVTTVAPMPPPPQKTALQKIDEEFERVNAQSGDQANYEPLMQEIRQAMASLGSDAAGTRTKRQLEMRLELLKLRKEHRDSLKAIKASRQAAGEQTKLVEEKVAQLEKSRVYTITGRLRASPTYNGRGGLPKLYRVLSEGEHEEAQTLGYLRDDPGLELEGKLGQMVGIVGEAGVHPTLKVNMINAVRVDLLAAGSAAAETAPSERADEQAEAQPAEDKPAESKPAEPAAAPEEEVTK